MHASIPYNDEKPRDLNMIELLGWREVHSPFVKLQKEEREAPFIYKGGYFLAIW